MTTPLLELTQTQTLLDSRKGYENGLGYKLAGVGSYGLDVAIDAPDIDENRMCLTFPFADGRRRDGVGDLLEVGGIRTDRHRLNPVVLFDHGKSVTMPIAKAEDPDTLEYTVALDPATQVATCKAFFYQCQDAGGDYQHALFCEQLFDLVVKRYIRAGSIGFTVVQARELPPNYETGTPKGLHLMAVNMLEASIVVMPANQDTVRKALSLNRVCGKPLSPVLVKSLAPYAPERKAQFGYEGKSESYFSSCERDDVGRCLPSGGSGSEKDEQSNPEGKKRSYKPPTTTKVAGVVARAARDAMEKIYEGDSSGACYSASMAVMLAFPSAELWSGTYRGSPHTVVKVGDYFIDVTADQFGSSPVKVMTALPSAYRNFDKVTNPGGVISGEEEWKQVSDMADQIREYIESKRKATNKSMPVVDSKAVSQCGETCTCKVPLDSDLSKTDVPPARWKPGLGAEKTVRMASTRTTTGFQVGDVVIARDYLTSWKGTARSQFAKPGDRLKVVEVVQEGLVKVQNGNGDTMELTGSSVRKKGLDSDLKDIRLKYRKTKSVRRRVKKSTPGSAMVYMSGKDLAEAKKMAEGKGVKFNRVGVKGDLEKIKLTGDDESIDQVAKKYGKPLRGIKNMSAKSIDQVAKKYGKSLRGIKHMSAKSHDPNNSGRRVRGPAKYKIGDKVIVDGTEGVIGNMAEDSRGWAYAVEFPSGYGQTIREENIKKKNMMNTNNNRSAHKTKDLDPNPVPGDEAMDQVVDDNEMVVPPEKYSAQVIRRMHENYRILMAETDRMMGPLENDAIRALVEEELSHHDEFLIKLEDAFTTHHSDLPGLDGADAKDMDEDGMVSEEELDENAEDDLVDDKEMDGEATDAVPADSVDDNPDEDTTDEEVAEAMMNKALKAVPAIRLKYRKKTLKKEKALTEEEVGDIKEEIDTQATDTEADPVEESTSAEGKGMLKAHELAQCKGAMCHLKEVSETTDWDDEWRMKSYHYHKVLDEIGTSSPDGVQPVDSLNGGPAADNSGAKSIEPEGDGYHKDMGQDPHPHRKMCKNCSGFLGRLAHEKAFGDVHREEALVHHKEMEGMMTSYGQQADLPDMSEEPEQAETSQEDVPVGDVQEKRLSKLEAMLSRLELCL